MDILKIKELTRENFTKFGTFSNMLFPQTEKIGDKPVSFFRDITSTDLGQCNIASLSVCLIEKRDLVIDVLEYHNRCNEMLMPLDGSLLLQVAPATAQDEPYGKIEVFRVPKGTAIVLNYGVWHHAPFAYKCDAVNVFAILPERTYKNDCYVLDIPEEKRIRIIEN